MDLSNRRQISVVRVRIIRISLTTTEVLCASSQYTFVNRETPRSSYVQQLFKNVCLEFLWPDDEEELCFKIVKPQRCDEAASIPLLGYQIYFCCSLRAISVPGFLSFVRIVQFQ